LPFLEIKIKKEIRGAEEGMLSAVGGYLKRGNREPAVIILVIRVGFF
jgi:hypothetical protein